MRGILIGILIFVILGLGGTAIFLYLQTSNTGSGGVVNQDTNQNTNTGTNTNTDTNGGTQFAESAVDCSVTCQDGSFFTEDEASTYPDCDSWAVDACAQVGSEPTSDDGSTTTQSTCTIESPQETDSYIEADISCTSDVTVEVHVSEAGTSTTSTECLGATIMSPEEIILEAGEQYSTADAVDEFASGECGKCIYLLAEDEDATEYETATYTGSCVSETTSGDPIPTEGGTYNCTVGYQCVEVVTGATGAYSSFASCEEACVAPAGELPETFVSFEGENKYIVWGAFLVVLSILLYKLKDVPYIAGLLYFGDKATFNTLAPNKRVLREKRARKKKEKMKKERRRFEEGFGD